MVEKKKFDNWFLNAFKGLNIWIIILLAMWLWNVFIEPALARDFATRNDIISLSNELESTREKSDGKIKELKNEMQTAISKLEHKIDANSEKLDKRMQSIYNILIQLKR